MESPIHSVGELGGPHDKDQLGRSEHCSGGLEEFTVGSESSYVLYIVYSGPYSNHNRLFHLQRTTLDQDHILPGNSNIYLLFLIMSIDRYFIL